jgi:hypothetical protein
MMVSTRGGFVAEEVDGGVENMKFNPAPVADPYLKLREVLRDAFNHASIGKGLERHACGEPFEQQTICQTARAHGIGFCTGQAEKKARESHRLLPMDGGVDRAVSELLGAINYLAAAVIVIRERA